MSILYEKEEGKTFRLKMEEDDRDFDGLKVIACNYQAFYNPHGLEKVAFEILKHTNGGKLPQRHIKFVLFPAQKIQAEGPYMYGTGPTQAVLSS